jgi:iron(III) transport system ATP-binding protein
VILSLRGIQKSYGGQVVVKNLSFDMNEGEVVTLLGPSGCGKSTTLRMIAGLEHPDAGEVWLKDRLVASSERGVFTPPNKRNLGLVFQNYAIWPHMTVAKNIAYPLRVRRWTRDRIAARVAEMLELTRLSHLRDRMANELSGGQQQRVALARALAYEPDILLLDEPLSNLDALLRRELRLQLKALQARLRTSFLYVTHDQEEAMALSTKIIVMNQGAIEQMGDAASIYERPASRFVQRFVGASIVFSGVVEQGQIRIGESLIRHNAHGLSDGARVDVMSRPEHMTLDRAGSGIKGVITQTSNFGHIVECVVQLSGADDQSVLLNTSKAAGYTIGQEVFIRLDCEQARVFNR